MKKITIILISGLFICFFGAKALYATVQIGALGEFGFGGEYDSRIEWNGGHINGEDDLDPTPGFGLYVEVPVAFDNMLIIGGETRFLWVDLEDSVNDDLYWDLAAYIKFSYPVTSAFNLYLRVAPGFTVYFPDADNYDNGVGFNIGSFIGPEFKFTENFGIFAEMGFIFHKVYGDVDFASSDAEYKIDFIQFHLNMGLFVRF